MDSSLINQYKINFKIVYEEYLGKMEYIKYPYMANEQLFDFLDNWRDANSINRDLLPVINDAVNGVLPIEESAVLSGATLITLDEDVVSIYNDGVSSFENPIWLFQFRILMQLLKDGEISCLDNKPDGSDML